MALKEHIRPERTYEDEELLIIKSQSNPASFRPLYEKYFKQIFLFILHRVGDKEQTADITSQVFLKGLLNIKKYELRGLPFSAWLYRIALNECNEYFRKNKRYRMITIEEDAVDHLYDELIGESPRELLREKLPDVLQKLSEAELQIIELRFFEQRSFKEVGEILGITETHAKVKVYRILDRMKKIYFLKDEAKN